MRTAAGDDTGAAPSLVWLGGDRALQFAGWPEILQAGVPLHLDPAGCQFLLAYGLVPPPYTLYRGIYSLGVGDRLRIEEGRPAFSVDYPWFEGRSRGDGRFEERVLRMLLAEAVARAVPPDCPALLMQSAGKDSTGLLLGIAQERRGNVRAVTYDAGRDEQEAGPASALARHFGVPHQVVRADPEAEFAAYLKFAERSPAICADLTLFSYLLTLERAEVDGGVVIDGLGSDGYMGYVVPKRDAILGKLALARQLPLLWGCCEPPAIGDKAAYLWKTALMYPAERCLAGSRLAPATVRKLLPHATPFHTHFADLDRRWRNLSPLDFRSYIRARIFDGAGTMVKGRLAAASFGARAVFPYCDRLLIDYCFHLPRAERYDLRARINKLPLRRLLRREVGDSPYLQQKGSFRFDVRRFVAVNEAGIRAEIEQAAPLLRGVSRTAGFLLARKSNYVHAYALTTLFMVAAWLTRRPSEVVQPLVEAGTAGEQCVVEV